MFPFSPFQSKHVLANCFKRIKFDGKQLLSITIQGWRAAGLVACAAQRLASYQKSNDLEVYLGPDNNFEKINATRTSRSKKPFPNVYVSKTEFVAE